MTIPIDQEQKDFFVNVYDVVKCIPEGRVTSYGAIAKYLCAPSASRTVGWAMNSSHKFSEIPAHRVVNRNGMLTGKMHFKTPKSMQKKLEKKQGKAKKTPKNICAKTKEKQRSSP